MHSLRELQQRFVNGLLSDDDDAALPLFADSEFDARERFALYRNNCRAGFLAALSAAYPVMRRLTGEAYFRQLILEYQFACPSPSGNLAHAGERLPEYLQTRFDGTGYEYFSDVARLESACQQVLDAADHAPLDTDRLALVEPQDRPRLLFALHPAVRLVDSPYPVVRIWEAHQGAEDPEQLDISTGGEQALVCRRGERVSVCRLSPAEHACLAALHDSRPLATAIDDALRLDPDLDLPEALQRWVRARFIVDFSIATVTSNK